MAQSVAGNFGQIIETGVDYLTVTARTGAHREALHALGRHLCSEEENAGAEVRLWRFSGYRGFSSESVSWGLRREDSILRLSSNVASEFWTMAFQNSDNVSRIDVQVTVRTARPVTKVLQSMRRSTHRGKKGVGRPRQYHYHIERSGPTAITVGSRASDVYLRAYNKEIESGLEHYSGCLRFEAELKRRQAKHIATQIHESSHPQIWIQQYISRLFHTRCHSRPFPADILHLKRAPEKPSRSSDRLTWHLKHLERIIEIQIARGCRDGLEAFVKQFESYRNRMLISA